MLKLLSRVGNLLRGRSVIDDELLEELEETLIQADVSAPLAVKLVQELRDKAKITYQNGAEPVKPMMMPPMGGAPDEESGATTKPGDKKADKEDTLTPPAEKASDKAVAIPADKAADKVPAKEEPKMQ